MNKGFIQKWETMLEALGEPAHSIEMPVFCQNHKEEGCKVFRELGPAGLTTKAKVKTVQNLRIKKVSLK